MYKLRHIYYYMVDQKIFFFPLRFSYILVEGPSEVFCISKINDKSLHRPVRKPKWTLNRTNIYKRARLSKLNIIKFIYMLNSIF